MIDKYGSITEVLKGDETASLFLWCPSSNAGVNYGREASIMEPNPDEGKTGGSGDQEYTIGPRRDRLFHKFRARDALEALDLLERKCQGEDVKNTVRSSRTHDCRDPGIHGREPQGGLDSWLYAGMQYEIQIVGGVLQATMKSYNFPVKIVVSTGELNTIHEGINHHQINEVPYSALRDLNNGTRLRPEILHEAKWKTRDSTMAEAGQDILSEDFLRQYLGVAEQFAPFNITKNAKDALLVSMLLRPMFDDSGERSR